MNEPPKKLGEALSPLSEERLDSWKEIASHLDRSVRTVRRWEENENLPVRRHNHGKGSTVFALKSELDAWLAQRFESPRVEATEAETTEEASVEPASSEVAAGSPLATESREVSPAVEAGARVVVEAAETTRAGGASSARIADLAVSAIEAPTPLDMPTPSARPGPERPASRTAGWLAVAGLAAALVAVFSFLPQRAREMSPMSRPAAQVLISDAEGVTEDAISTEVFESLLRRELSRSPVFELVSRDRVDSALDLARRDRAAGLDAETALDVAWRIGDVDALFVPRLERVGSQFVVNLHVLDPTRGASVTHLSEPIDKIDELMPALGNLAARATRLVASRHSWQEEERTAPPLVTTDSSAALRLYAEADQLRRNNRVIAAEQLLRKALADDPDFAAAHLQLAWSLYERGAEVETVRAALAAAERSSRDASAAEQLFLQASLDFFESRPGEALSTFDALLTLSPGHYWGNRTAGTLCWAVGGDSTGDCLRYPVRMAEAAPESAQANFEAAWSLALWSDAPERAEPFIDRARTLVARDGDLVTPLERARIELFPVYEKWYAKNTNGVLDEQRAIAARFDGFGSELQSTVAREMGYLSLALGRNDEAETWFRRLPDPASRHEALAMLVFTEDDPAALAAHLEEGAGYRDPMTPILFSMAGLPEESEALLARLEAAGVEEHYLGLGRGLNAMASGQVDDAIGQFEESVEHLRPDHRGLFFAGADLLAVAFSKKGDLRRAVATLETVAGHRRRAAFMGSGIFWMKCQLRLAGFYREIGREQDAEQIEIQLLDLLRDSDDDYPMKARLQALIG